MYNSNISITTKRFRKNGWLLNRAPCNDFNLNHWLRLNQSGQRVHQPSDFQDPCSGEDKLDNNFDGFIYFTVRNLLSKYQCNKSPFYLTRVLESLVPTLVVRGKIGMPYQISGVYVFFVSLSPLIENGLEEAYKEVPLVNDVDG